jgi:ER membrane protein complex subunit 6
MVQDIKNKILKYVLFRKTRRVYCRWFCFFTRIIACCSNILCYLNFLFHSRTFLSIIGGVVAGIWGFTGFTGFVFYFVVMLAASLGLAAKAKFSASAYFDSWNRVLLDGILGGLMVSFLPPTNLQIGILL